MSYAKSFYADQKPVEKEQNLNTSDDATPSIEPIAENPLSPSQIQEAIRLYRNVISNSAPQSPIHRQNVKQRNFVEKQVVHSNYYGGGPTDIPQSYLVNYNRQESSDSPSKNCQTPKTPTKSQNFDQKLLNRLENLSISQPENPEVSTPEFVSNDQKENPLLIEKKSEFNDEESNYCFNKKEKTEEKQFDVAPSFYPSNPVSTISTPNKLNRPTVPSNYIGMSNDCRFIYDSKGSIPASYQLNNNQNQPKNNFILQNPRKEQQQEDNGTTTTEDVTQRPLPSPAPHSRFRSLIRNIGETATTLSDQYTSPIVVEKVENQNQQQQQNVYYDAFAPINQIPSESEYQLPVLNDLASCIENY